MNEVFGVDVSLVPIVIFSIGIGLILVLVVALVTTYGQQLRRVRAAIHDAEDIEDLAAARNRYFAEMESAKSFLEENQSELLRVEAEREAQERLRMELTELEQKRSEAEEQTEAARKEVLDLQHAVTSLAEDRERLTREIEEHKHAHKDATTLITEHDETVAKLNEAEQALEELREEYKKMRGIVEDALRQRDTLAADIKTLEFRQGGLETELTRLESEVQQRRHELKQSSDDSLPQYTDLFDVEPECLKAGVFRQDSLSRIDELTALDNVSNHLNAQGLIFSPRILRAFHTCMKVSDISPITVLAGISGTGKSELPMRYAEAMGIHSLRIAVQPSWSSPQDLFGFYNYLEKRYKATELARVLVRMDPYNFRGDQLALKEIQKASRSSRLLLVLIDEMNLARVEYYFSEFLSTLEARRAVVDPSDPIKRAPAEIEIEGSRRSSEDDELSAMNIRLWVGSNVLFAGTMNEDESTQTLSDKVLDRSNVLRFGKPPARDGATTNRSDNFRSEQALAHETWKSWIQTSRDAPWTKEVDDWTERLNDSLEKIGRPFGWRVRDAIHQYIANYPGVRGGSEYKTAMADQVEQKIIPKLRGLDLIQSQESLNGVLDVLDELGDEVLLNTFRECQQDTMYGTFNWRGVTRE